MRITRSFHSVEGDACGITNEMITESPHCNTHTRESPIRSRAIRKTGSEPPNLDASIDHRRLTSGCEDTDDNGRAVMFTRGRSSVLDKSPLVVRVARTVFATRRRYPRRPPPSPRCRVERADGVNVATPSCLVRFVYIFRSSWACFSYSRISF